MFLAAVLSIIGLAVNDTIVVFDRIRERTRAGEGRLRETVNEAILQTVPRTVNTGLGAMFILATLAVLGGDSLTDFAVALLLGLSVGIYSTIFTAAPLAIWAEERWPPVARSARWRREGNRRPLRRHPGRRTGERVALAPLVPAGRPRVETPGRAGHLRARFRPQPQRARVIHSSKSPSSAGGC